MTVSGSMQRMPEPAVVAVIGELEFSARAGA
jgi:hypothetical protein